MTTSDGHPTDADVDATLSRVRTRVDEENGAVYLADPVVCLGDLRWTLAHVERLRTELATVRERLSVIHTALGADPVPVEERKTDDH